VRKYSEVQAERLQKHEAEVRQEQQRRSQRQELIAQLSAIVAVSEEAGAAGGAREKVRQAVLSLHADPAEVLCDGCGCELWHLEPGLFYENPLPSRKVGCPGCGWIGWLAAAEELPRPKPWARGR
jgi:hypothetical protein